MLRYIEDELIDRNSNQITDKKRPFPYEIKCVDPEINSELLTCFTGEKTGFVQVGPKKWFFPSGYAKEAENFYNFELRPDDVFIITFPRSGTTWTQEMVWLLCNNLDFAHASQLPLTERVPFLEFNCFVHPDTKAQFLKENKHDPEKSKLVKQIDYPAWKSLSHAPDRRFIKTHLPFSLLPPDLLKVGCKVIYIARNPKDVAVSFYHLNRSIRTQGYTGDFPKYWAYFQNNLQPWTPYWEHIKEGWSRKHEKNMLFMFYEDMNKNPRNGLVQVANFLEQSYTNDQLDKLEEHLRIDNFRQNKSVNYDILKDLGIFLSTEGDFIRKGKTGGWKDYFDEKLNREADEWIEKNLRGTGIRFPCAKSN
ncbi:sulfotransferase 1B1-like isoform X2 [Cylas formicarius]|uniref:sulfotransferase 1B1-like isoform X2 n=1 Tax=Cylas formicarius TaxID=197179 RepID=UPI0029584A33|nr:sulfotransferase 1B1-like isoform X2 [Cylas formicarius]